ncbi:DUF3108 domain-containing protein [Agitococcus lubricus]|uniref:Uncharacterized protein DUF3108 n=1 Tax=Agitococcus lubricus TaxID=1077255 RepID=A0A2T5IWV1_9GAMM|nr:DUF3108 domain-containing protein [Agitococcus lubricus]PTQ88395.1 uncharacterized protein DUF3108 [Agitococcus lubricus]
MPFVQTLRIRLQRKPLATALAASVLVHLCLLWDGEFELPDFSPDSPDEVLSKKKADAIPRVKLSIKPPARPKPQVGAAIVTLIEEAPPAAEKIAPSKNNNNKKQLTKEKIKPEKPLVEPISGDDFAPPSPQIADNPKSDNASTEQVSEDAIPLGDSLPPPPEELAKTPPIAIHEEPPPFPVEIAARYKASFMGFSVEIKQMWRMEGERYIIENEASKFGFKAKMVSEGGVSVNGISPEQYRVYINNKLNRFADIDRSNNTIRFGKKSDVKYAALQGEIQDAASLPFQVAVSFVGTESRQLQITTGSAVYNIELKLISEERLKLPAGEMRTLHLQGQRINLATGIAQQGYDVWLAPDYRNFPVKFRGPTSKGEVMEYSLKSLAFEGQTVIGKNLKPEPESKEPDAIPKELLEHAEEPPPSFKSEVGVGEDAP